MKFALSLLFFGAFAFAQSPSNYHNDRDESHLCGPFQIEAIEKDSLYASWFQKNYTAIEAPSNIPKWVEKLDDTTVEIYMGTWCGDSKKWVPRFLKLWDAYGLDRSKLQFTALYDTDEKYKQGPNGEEKGKKIHRVPTFIFKRDGTEYARIVESPRNDLKTDLQQIALGVSSEPNYRGASYLIDVLEKMTPEEIYKDVNRYFSKCYDLVCKSRELNTLVFVFLRAGEIEKAFLTFNFNRHYFKNEAYVHASMAEAFQINNDKEKAINNYKKALELDPENKKIKEKIAVLEKEIQK
ncbi:MAG: hypothetical protein ABF256_02985 [Candidatus Arcticimaribacter sp.]